MKFVGTYRVVANYDLDKNDYPRMKDGTIDPSYDDIYIVCQKGGKIYHYGHKILEAYVQSIGRGRNILKEIYKIKNKTNDFSQFIEVKTGVNKLNEPTITETFDNDMFYKYMGENKLVEYIQCGDEEVSFRFNVSDIKIVAELMKAKTSGASIKPFSKKNLPKKKYQIPLVEIAQYESVTKSIPKEDNLIIGRITNRFIGDIIGKKGKAFDTNADMKLKMIHGKEYIHSMGYFEEYVNYLGKEYWRK